MTINRRQFIRIGSLTAAHAGLASFIPPFVGERGAFVKRGTENMSDLYSAFRQPPQSSQVGGFWWWFNGLVSREGITRDLQEFHDKGIGEVLMINTASGLGGAKMPQGVKFLSEEWRVLYRHALQEAARLGITVGVNFTSGWCMGGPWIEPQHAGRWFLQS